MKERKKTQSDAEMEYYCDTVRNINLWPELSQRHHLSAIWQLIIMIIQMELLLLRLKSSKALWLVVARNWNTNSTSNSISISTSISASTRTYDDGYWDWNIKVPDYEIGLKVRYDWRRMQLRWVASESERIWSAAAGCVPTATPGLPVDCDSLVPICGRRRWHF